eukprot:CAMPEP_0117427276 /NCGR_PEP_ID=MMETSP0758-20121206/7162_1 /TAXON_ID=63605 /ORGANISM="Percolomonas cosmopolitus, Strain AE-1 (ATCC 50343)" /LENGTH=251 /DNA_ID=CAMNT_0005212827 /DNA_START=11 /DNA_END=766 /DNA_ORIENTATION=-
MKKAVIVGDIKQDQSQFKESYDVIQVDNCFKIASVDDASLAFIGIFLGSTSLKGLNTDTLYAKLMDGGVLHIMDISDSSDLEDELLMSGFDSIVCSDGKLKASRKATESTLFSLNEQKDISNQQQDQQQESIWEIDQFMDDDLIDDDDALLNESDTCSATIVVDGQLQQRKPCKDCTCGRKEEYEIEQQKKKQEEEEAKKKKAPPVSFVSSCGSCGLGDAFRCSTCPYYGMPKFESKPGQTIRLTNLSSDL